MACNEIKKNCQATMNLTTHYKNIKTAVKNLTQAHNKSRINRRHQPQ
ncbi:hypothetical protein O59_002439 [Cellvibrio sp. BR]|nr:hypothetical protein O59_002439 [Cellvibrio sp. BR]